MLLRQVKFSPVPAAREGLYCILTKAVGPTIRGGESSCRVRMGQDRVHSQGDKLDVLVCFNWKNFKFFEHETFVKKNAGCFVFR